MSDTATLATGFCRLDLELENVERLVLRFPRADASVQRCEGERLRLELEIRGPAEELEAWKPAVRRVEGIIVVAEGEGRIAVTELRVRVPASISDVEIHTREGDIEVSGLEVGIVAETESGSVRVVGASSLEARCSGGDVVVEDCGTSLIKTSSGSIRILRSKGTVTVATSSGDIDTEDSGGDLLLETKSGEITVLRPRGRVMAQTLGGDVEVEAPGPFGGGDIATATGCIDLAFGGADLELRAETLSGRLVTPQGEIFNSAGPRRCALSIGKGGRRIHAKSVSGDIQIDC